MVQQLHIDAQGARAKLQGNIARTGCSHLVSKLLRLFLTLGTLPLPKALRSGNYSVLAD